MLSVALYNIRSLYNVGSVFRTASGAGFECIYLVGYTGAPPEPRIAKVALGAEQEVPFRQLESLDRLLSEIEEHFVVALEQHPESSPYNRIELPPDRPVTLVVGEELFGTPPELIERADAVAEIPMAGVKESLNVASAFAVVAYDFATRTGVVGARDLRSRKSSSPPREGVLTHGPTIGEEPTPRPTGQGKRK